MFEFSEIDSILDGLARGEMIVVVDDPNRENEGDLVMIAEKVTPEAINFMATYGRGLICMPVEQTLAKQLALEPMVQCNTDTFGTAFTVSIDYDNGSTGISAADRAITIANAVKVGALPEEFKRPGHIFPLIAKAGGVLERRGHTEASVDLARLAGYRGAAVICEILNPDGTMARLPELQLFAKEHGLKMMTIESLSQYLQNETSKESVEKLEVLEAVQMPTAYGNFQMKGFINKQTGEHHLALFKGLEKTKNPLVRIHSECLTGDVFGSRRCDCGEQLEMALKAIAGEGAGAVIYLRQEGRGIGLPEKLKAYALQERGFDTVSANIELGHAVDNRDYKIAASILNHLGVGTIRLITNNPEKVLAMTENQIKVSEEIRLQSTIYPSNAGYLKTKKEQLGQQINV